MAYREDIALMAHLMRRAGFGASRAELDARVARGYEATVEELLEPDSHGIPENDEDLLFRHAPGTMLPGGVPLPGQANYIWQMINTRRPLEEKMALFWHHVFATGNSKVDNCDQLLAQINMFRRRGMGSYRELLVELAKNPAMIFWLDNNQNHKDQPNENWGRELLELFSMGVGNYTEQDVFECSRAFTGWTIRPQDSPAAAGSRFSLVLRVQTRGSRRYGEGVPGPPGPLQRGGRHRHHRPTAGHGAVHRPAPVRLLCCR